jgi:site-specific recombinase XerD
LGCKNYFLSSFHTAYFNSAVDKNGVDVSDLSALLGHNDTGTLKKYLSLQREQSSKKAGKAMEKILK